MAMCSLIDCGKGHEAHLAVHLKMSVPQCRMLLQQEEAPGTQRVDVAANHLGQLIWMPPRALRSSVIWLALDCVGMTVTGNFRLLI